MENVQFSEETIKCAIDAVVKTANNIFNAAEGFGPANLQAVAELKKAGFEDAEKIAQEYGLVLRKLSNAPASTRNAVMRVANLAIGELMRKQYELEAKKAGQTEQALNFASNAPKAEKQVTARQSTKKADTAKKRRK